MAPGLTRLLSMLDHGSANVSSQGFSTQGPGRRRIDERRPRWTRPSQSVHETRAKQGD